MSDPAEPPATTADTDLLARLERLRLALASVEGRLGLAVERQRLLLERVQRIEKRVFRPDWPDTPDIQTIDPSTHVVRPKGGNQSL